MVSLTCRAEETTWSSDCFEESYASGRADITDPKETQVTAKSDLDSIATEIFGKDSRVAFLNYCTELTSQYI